MHPLQDNVRAHAHAHRTAVELHGHRFGKVSWIASRDPRVTMQEYRTEVSHAKMHDRNRIPRSV
jgi:hypothetical protein